LTHAIFGYPVRSLLASFHSCLDSRPPPQLVFLEIGSNGLNINRETIDIANDIVCLVRFIICGYDVKCVVGEITIRNGHESNYMTSYNNAERPISRAATTNRHLKRLVQ